MRPSNLSVPLLALVLGSASAAAQGTTASANPADVASPAALVKAAYETVSRAPGKPFQWDRFRSLFLPGARLIPNTEQTRGTFTTHTVETFITWIDEGWRPVIGTPNDRGFAETEVRAATVAGFAEVGLGPRTLRADTAPLAALAFVALSAR